MKTLQSFLDKSFKGSKTKKLEELVSPLKHGGTIPKGTLVIMASGDARLRLKILEKDTPHKGFSTPLIMNYEAQDMGISSNYLHWYLSHEEIKEQLIKHATGSVILDRSLNLPMTHFISLQKMRNSAIHIGLNRNKLSTFTEEDLGSFNHIIKYFGI